jgi:ABC-type lipoprotein release transport system permease subunit
VLFLKLAWRNLFRNTRRTLLTVMLISCSLAALIITDGTVVGLVEMMENTITRTLTGEGQIHHKDFMDDFDSDLMINNPDSVIEVIKANSDVMAYAPRIMIGGMIASSYNMTGGLIYGVDPERELNVSRIKDALIAGEYLSGTDRQILMGKGMAELLEVTLQDRIVVTVAQIGTGETSQELFRLSGILEFGPREMDEGFAFINLATAQRLIATEDGVHQIVVRFHDPALAKNREHSLYKSLTHGDIEAISWLDFNPSISSVIQISNFVTLILGVVLFFVASLGVINSLFMSIYERIHEFGIAKAVGTTPYNIIQLVMLEALIIAVVSCVLGGLLGYLSSSWFSVHGLPIGEFEVSGIAIDGSIKTKVLAQQFILFPAYIVLLTLAAALYPALFASRIVPAVALQRSL